MSLSSDQPYHPSLGFALSPHQMPASPSGSTVVHAEDSSGSSPTNNGRIENQPASSGAPLGRTTGIEPEDTTKDRYADTSTTIWSLYLEQAKLHDRELTETMKDDTNGVLVFTGLFAAVVAAFIIESYKKLQPDSGDVAAILLSQISQQLAAAANGTFLVPSQIPDTAFHPTSSSIRVNVLWFISLLLSLSCALAATLMQQWARRYISKTQSAQRAGSPQRQGQIHAYLFMGLQTFHMKSALEALPALIHASVFLFFAGLVDFLLPINKTVAYVVLAIVILDASLYLGVTFLPILYPNSPYATPLSSVGTVYPAIIRGIYEICQTLLLLRLSWIAKLGASHRRENYPVRLMEEHTYPLCSSRIHRLIHRAVLRLWIRMAGLASIVRNSLERRKLRVSRSSLWVSEGAAVVAASLHTSAANWTLTMVMDDNTLFERFFEGLPGFISSAGHNATIIEALTASGCGMRIGGLLSSMTYPGLGSDPARTRSTLSHLRCLRELASPLSVRVPRSYYWPEFLINLLPPLNEFRGHSDPDIAVAACCTAAALTQFLHDRVHELGWDDDARLSTYPGLYMKDSMSYFVTCLIYLVQTEMAPFYQHRHPYPSEHRLHHVYSLGKLYNAMALIRGITNSSHLSSTSPNILTLTWDTVERVTSVSSFGEEWEEAMIGSKAMDMIVPELEQLRSRITHRANQDRARSFNQHGTPFTAKVSPYATLHDKLRPFYDWLFGFEERRQIYLTQHLFPVLYPQDPEAEERSDPSSDTATTFQEIAGEAETGPHVWEEPARASTQGIRPVKVENLQMPASGNNFR